MIFKNPFSSLLLFCLFSSAIMAEEVKKCNEHNYRPKNVQEFYSELTAELLSTRPTIKSLIEIWLNKMQPKLVSNSWEIVDSCLKESTFYTTEDCLLEWSHLTKNLSMMRIDLELYRDCDLQKKVEESLELIGMVNAINDIIKSIKVLISNLETHFFETYFTRQILDSINKEIIKLNILLAELNNEMRCTLIKAEVQSQLIDSLSSLSINEKFDLKQQDIALFISSYLSDHNCIESTLTKH